MSGDSVHAQIGVFTEGKKITQELGFIIFFFFMEMVHNQSFSLCECVCGESERKRLDG